jgi:hypothetical protein
MIAQFYMGFERFLLVINTVDLLRYAPINLGD